MSTGRRLNQGVITYNKGCLFTAVGDTLVQWKILKSWFDDNLQFGGSLRSESVIVEEQKPWTPIPNITHHSKWGHLKSFCANWSWTVHACWYFQDLALLVQLSLLLLIFPSTTTATMTTSTITTMTTSTTIRIYVYNCISFSIVDMRANPTYDSMTNRIFTTKCIRFAIPIQPLWMDCSCLDAWNKPKMKWLSAWAM